VGHHVFVWRLIGGMKAFQYRRWWVALSERDLQHSPQLIVNGLYGQVLCKIDGQDAQQRIL